ncbi:MAG: beta-ketoacyl synthase N-terminal-like domain-containing protein [Haloarculaceae archaeon]
MTAVYVAGVGTTAFGTHPDRSGRDLLAAAADEAFADAGVGPDAVDGLYYGNFLGLDAERQGHQAPLMAESTGLTGRSALRFEQACASGGVAVREAVRTIRAGQADVLLVGGMERMNHLDTATLTEALGTAADARFEGRVGLTFPGAYALMARAYVERYGGSRTDLAHVAVKNHEHALDNDDAQLQQRISVADVLDAPTIADPLGLYDACPTTDGASALVLASSSAAADHGLDDAVTVAGVGHGTDRLPLQGRTSLVRTPATERAAAQAYADAAIDPADVDFAEVHDCFTIAEVLAIEGLGFADLGSGIDAARRGETTADGARPINLSGGLKAKGHPVGATGVSQVVEVTKLLRGTHPNSDAVDGRTTAVAHNAGGTVASAVVHVLEGQR